MGVFWQRKGFGGYPIDEMAAKAWAAEIAAGIPAEGILTGTRLATQAGWQPVERLRAGDLVLTFDAGPQPVSRVERISRDVDLSALPHLWPLAVPAGALGNAEAFWLLPEQPVLIEADAAETLYGDPFVLVPGLALDGWNGIGRSLPPRRLELVTLEFAEDQTVYCSGGALLHCAADASPLDRLLGTAPAAAPRLDYAEAARLVAAMAQGSQGGPRYS